MKTLKIVKNTKYFVSVSVGLILIGMIVLAVKGLNLGIEFSKGTLMTIDFKQQVNDGVINNVKQTLEKYGVKDAQVLSSGQGQSKTETVIRMKQFDSIEKENAIQNNVMKDLNVKYPNAKFVDIEKVGPIAGNEMARNAFYSVLIGCGFMLLYIWMRFELLSGVAAIIALVHDVLFMVAGVAIFRTPINSSFIAAVLTIVGYSINDTIVVFDRIRENNRKPELRKLSRSEVVDISITETFTRCINTTMTVLFCVAAIYVLGVESIREFAFPLLIGILSGAYSSIFIASPIWALWHDRVDAKKKAERKSKKLAKA